MERKYEWSFEDEVIDRLARIEEKIDSVIIPAVSNHEQRIRCLEIFKNKTIGAGKFFGFLASGGILIYLLDKIF